MWKKFAILNASTHDLPFCLFCVSPRDSKAVRGSYVTTSLEYDLPWFTIWKNGQNLDCMFENLYMPDADMSEWEKYCTERNHSDEKLTPLHNANPLLQHVCIYKCTRILIQYIYIYTYIHINEYICIYMYVYIYVCICTNTLYIHTYIYIHVYTHIHI